MRASLSALLTLACGSIALSGCKLQSEPPDTAALLAYYQEGSKPTNKCHTTAIEELACEPNSGGGYACNFVQIRPNCAIGARIKVSGCFNDDSDGWRRFSC